jgi:hypothetical protein
MFSKISYDCRACSFQTNNKTLYQRHIETNKHKKKNKECGIVIDCECGSNFKHMSSYYRHRKICPANKQPHQNILYDTSKTTSKETLKETLKDDLIETIFKMNQITLDKVVEQNDKNLDKFIKLQETQMENQIETFKEAQKNIKELAIKCGNNTTTTNVQLNNHIINSQKTIQFLNQNLPDMIDMETFIYNYKGDYKLNEDETKTLLESYQLNGVKGYAKCLSFFLKDNCNRQLKDKNIEYPKKISFPLTLTDSNLRSVKIKTENGWDTTTDDQVLSRIIIISNDQVYLHHKTCIYLPETAKNTIITQIKKDNPFQKIKSSFEYIKD